MSLIIRVVDLLFGALNILLVVRLALAFFRASPQAIFSRFIGTLTQPFVSPFLGLFGATTVGGYVIEWSLVSAILAYAVLHGAVRAALRALARA